VDSTIYGTRFQEVFGTLHAVRQWTGLPNVLDLSTPSASTGLREQLRYLSLFWPFSQLHWGAGGLYPNKARTNWFLRRSPPLTAQAMQTSKFNSVPRQAPYAAPADRVGSLASVIPLVGLVLCTVVLCAIRVESSPKEPGPVPRLLTSKQGLAIVNAAWDYEQQTRGKPDCSHLVHQIYLLAGRDYPYASSFDLYAGSDSFRRVKTPQVGDLIIWPGHVGIVLDPAQHTFFSSVHSGLQAEFYDGPYWLARGRPRFYRYVIESSGSPASAVRVQHSSPERPRCSILACR